MTDDTVTAATISVIGVVSASLLSWLMNLSVRKRADHQERELVRFKSEFASSEERLRGDLARDLVAHESVLRVQAEMRLRLHERSWGILRDLIEAVGNCREAFNSLNGTILANASTATTQAAHDGAASALARVEALSAIAPPGIDLSPMLAGLNEAYVKMGEARFTPTLRSNLGGGAHFKLYDTVESSKHSFAKWNAELWQTVLKDAGERD